jgi:hypothetical protein
MKQTLAALVFMLTLTTFGCGVSSKYMTTLEVPQVVAVDPAVATVVFIRPSSYGGRVQHVIVDSKGRFLGECWGETYFVVKVPPGEHMFISWGEGTPALKATVEAGKVYYVEVGVTMGAWSARARLFAMGPQRESWAELPQWLKESTMLVPNEPAGQAYLQGRDDTGEVIQKGVKNYAEYDAEAIQKRTLLAADGVPAPVAAQ